MLIEPEIIAYIKDARVHGLKDIEIKQNLLHVGWTAESVHESFTHLESIVSLGIRGLKSEGFDSIGPSFVQPNETFSPTVTVTDSVPRKLKKKNTFRIILFAVSLMLLLGCIVFFSIRAYAYGHPIKFWNFFNSTALYNSYNTESSVLFTDTTKDHQPISFRLQNSAFVNIKDVQNPQLDGKLELNFKEKSQVFTTQIPYKIIGNIVFVNIGGIEQLKPLLAASGFADTVSWLKIDLNELQKGQSSTTPVTLSSILRPEVQKRITAIWTAKEFLKITKFAGKEKIKDVTTLHFVLAFDKTNFSQNIVATLAELLNDQTLKDKKYTQKDLDTLVTQVQPVFDTIDIHSIDAWVGITNFRLYKVSADISIPSVASGAVGESLLNSTGTSAASRDAQRISDTKQIGNILELYYNDHNGYPPSVHGAPQGLAPLYVSKIPTPPIPSDGNCNDYYNTYWYQPSGKSFKNQGATFYSSYDITFCLGSPMSGFSSGLAKVNPSGTQSGLACTDTTANCGKLQDSVGDVITPVSIIAATSTQTATIHIEHSLSNIGKTQIVTTPSQAVDILEMLKQRGNTLSSTSSPQIIK